MSSNYLRGDEMKENIEKDEKKDGKKMENKTSKIKITSYEQAFNAGCAGIPRSLVTMSGFNKEERRVAEIAFDHGSEYSRQNTPTYYGGEK